MEDQGSVTNLLVGLKAGDERAAQEIWERYFTRLVSAARLKLSSTSRRVADEEDVASLALEHLWNGVQAGRFPRLNDRDDLWQILLLLTDRRARDLARRNKTRRKHEIGESALSPSGELSPAELLEAADPSPEFAAEVNDRIGSLIRRLDDETLAKVAVWKLEGYENREIAERLQCGLRSVERKMALIRERLEDANGG